MTTLKMTLEFDQWDENLLAPEYAETNPQLWCWLDRNFERQPTKLLLKPGQTHVAVIEGKARTPSLPVSAMIGLQLFVDTHSEQGMRCTVDAGTDFIPVSQVHDRMRAHGNYGQNIEFVMRTAGNQIKGRLRARVTKMETDQEGALTWTASQLSWPLIGDLREQRNTLDRMVGDHVDMTKKMVMTKLREQSELTDRIRVPYYIGETGFELTRGVPLPAEAFLMAEIPSSNPAFWENAYKVALRRHSIQESQFGRLKPATKARLMVSMCTYVAQSLPYIGDRVNRNTRTGRYTRNGEQGYENFAQGLVTGSGDCEDSSDTILVTHEALGEADLSQCSSQIQELQAISRNYSTFMCLDSVTSAAVGGQGKGIGAHMNVFFLPNDWMEKAIRRGDARVANRLPFDRLEKQAGLPVLTGEGTGIFESTETGDLLVAQHKFINNMPSLQAWKRPIVHKQGTESPFYLSMLTGTTRAFYRLGSPAIAFTFADARTHIRGVHFEDMENASDAVEIVGHPVMRPDLLRICEEATKIRVPPNPLHLGTSVRGERPENKFALKTCKRIQGAVRALNRRPLRPGVAPVWAQLPVEHLTSQDADRIIMDVQRIPAIYDVDYRIVPTADAFSDNLVVDFYIDPSLVSH